MMTINSTSNDILDGLRALVRNLNRPDIASVQSLLSKVTGNRNAALMALRLLYWFPHATCEDGWVFKSWRDWDAECDLSPGQVKRVHRGEYLERIGIQRKVMKAHGTPTNHYRLDPDAMLQRIATFLQTTVDQVTAWIRCDPSQPSTAAQTNQPEQPVSTGQDDLFEPVKTTHSITNNTTPQQAIRQQTRQTSSALLALIELGIDPRKAQSLVSQHGEERVADVVRRATSPGIYNPAGCVIASLRRGWDRTDQPAIPASLLVDDGSRYVSGKYAEFIQW